jgi:hypothetical protein
VFKKIKRSAAGYLKRSLSNFVDDDRILIAQGILLQQLHLQSKNIQDYEFKVFSQFGDDGIIQFLIRKATIINPYFIEFGVEDYSESSTRFLLMNNNWSGFIMDGSKEAMNGVAKQPYFWKHDLRALAAFITKENINALMNETGWEDIGLLQIDIDGNDYWVLKEMDIAKLRPTILILEYNSVFGPERAITVPYKEDFQRIKAHYSNLYWGASLKALANLAQEKGYSFLGCNTAGNNAYFVRKDRLNDLHAVTIEEGYVPSKFRESRDKKGALTLIREKDRINVIKGLPVFNTETKKLENL